MAKDEDDLDRSAEWEPVSIPKKPLKPSVPKPVRASPVPPPVAAPVTPTSEEALDRSAEWAAVTVRSNKQKPPSTKPAGPTAVDIAKQVTLGDEAKKLLREGQTPRQYLDLLIDKKLYQDAANFWAHALPQREAVWWACLCIRQSSGGKLPEKEFVALEVAERWCGKPNEDFRQPALPAAHAAGFDTAAAWAATAVAWSSDNLSADQVIAADESKFTHAIKGSLLLATGTTDAADAATMYRRFLRLGIEVADGKNPIRGQKSEVRSQVSNPSDLWPPTSDL